MKRHALSIVIVMLTVAGAGTCPRAADVPADAKPSATVFPVVTKPYKFPADFARRVGTVIATFLEKAGLEDLQVADTMFDPPDSDDINKIAAAFGEKVLETPLTTDYAVLTHFLGTPQTGVHGIRSIVVDKSGKVVFAESAGKAEFDKAPLRPTDPMTCCMFVSRRLQELWNLEDPLRPDAPDGKMAQFWRNDARIPGRNESDAVSKRTEILKQNLKTATCTVYPIRVRDQSDTQCALDLVHLLGKGGVCKPEISQTDPALKLAVHSNERRILWDAARAFREFIKQNSPATDYALYADYAVLGTFVDHVHVIICDQSGDWVLVDMQNSHHPDFERINPKSATDCNRLLLARLQERLSE